MVCARNNLQQRTCEASTNLNHFKGMPAATPIFSNHYRSCFLVAILCNVLISAMLPVGSVQVVDYCTNVM